MTNTIYNLYPLPHRLEVSPEFFVLPESLRLESNIDPDAAILARLGEALALHDIELTDEADYVLALELVLSDGLTRQDAHSLSIDPTEIRVRAQTEAGLYYGLTSLYHILAQSEASLHSLVLEDYADTKLRGLIEGYYGIPWSDMSRKSIMDFGSYFKMNIYAFAPKDDPYHRDLWWEPYPEEPLGVIAELAAFGESRYNHYTWTIAPFKADSKPIREDNKETGLAQLIAKFEQLYAVGVRQFGVLGDDVGNLPYETVVYVMNEVNKWRREKGDVRELVFCPEGYNMDDWAFKDGSELNLYDQLFDPDIHIFFTGMSTCSPATKEAIHAFKTRAVTQGVRRDPLFWMNWPVNDIDRESYRRLFMGAGEVYEPGVVGMSGVLTNPMEEAEASKVSLFATLDYAWNIHAFNDLQSWSDSFAYIEPDVPEALHELAKHMSEVRNGAMPTAGESVELASLIEAFDRADAAGPADREAAAVRTAYEAIISAADEFTAGTKNKQLLQEMKPYIGNLRDKAEAALLYLEAYISGDEAIYEQASFVEEASRQHVVVTRTAEFPSTSLRAQTGGLVIDPHIEALKRGFKA